MQFDLEAVLLALPILLLSLTAHEFAHAWVALRQGDDTAYRQGRVTMNPAAHVDIIGTLVFPALAIGSGMPLLGWAKPVPTDPRKYRNFKRGDILVSIAGVCANAILAVLFAVLALLVALAARQATGAAFDTLVIAFRMLVWGVLGNLGLILFNLLPIPPLDGSHVFYHMLPPNAANSYRQLYPYGFIILWALVLTNALAFLWPVILYPAGLLLAPALAFAPPALTVTLFGA
jgi:Zn-dependent protease